MSRWVSGTNSTEADKASIYLVVLAEFNFDSGMIRVHDGVGPLTFSSNTYQGIGSYGSFDIIEENTETIARGLKVTLSGVETSLISTVMTEVYQGREATFYLGFLDANMAFVDTPEEIWSGRMDTMSISFGESSAVITLSCEHRLRKEPMVARYTDQDQRLAYSGDRFFDLVTKIPQFKASWGDKPNSYGDERNWDNLPVGQNG